MIDGESSLLVTKLAAAQRQLDAAIRMTLIGEDTLAIHTIAAAGYNILRDIKRKRGRSELTDRIELGLYSIALDIVSGHLRNIPDEIKESPIGVRIVENLIDLIRKGKIRSATDVSKFVKYSNSGDRAEGAFWFKFNLPANFLKHADRDSEGALDIDNLQNRDLLLGAIAAYMDIFPDLTPEMEAIIIYYYGDTSEIKGLGWSAECIKIFRALSPSKRRLLCLRYMRDDKKRAKARNTVHPAAAGISQPKGI